MLYDAASLGNTEIVALLIAGGALSVPGIHRTPRRRFILRRKVLQIPVSSIS